MTSTQKKTDALLDELLKGCRTPEDILGEHGLLKQLTRRMAERALEAEMGDRLGYETYAPEGRGTGNSRNGKNKKTVQSDAGQFEIGVPRDREGSFGPQLVRKRQHRPDGFDDKVLAPYARGLSTREIQAQLEELHGVEVSPALISNVTDAVYEEVRAWQSRPLAAVYPILYFDALYVKSREDGPVKNKAVYLAAAIRPIYTAPSAEAALAEPDAFAQGPCGEKFPAVATAWRRAWDRVIPFFAFPPPIRCVIHTTNAIELLNCSMRKVLKNRGAFPNDESILKLKFMGLKNVARKWTRPIRDWKAALNPFIILYGDRVSD